ncbi:MAG: type I phosphomannose isomerase catalytic subunit [Bryobacteraceae bacterium]
MSLRPVRLSASFKEKVWGSECLEPWYPSVKEKIGEVWFGEERNLPILVKFLFTSDRLSVQVHPDDEFAARHHGEGARGKTEMWHILRADPGAKIALGFREPVEAHRLAGYCASGEIERLLNWIEVEAGDTYFTPAGTVHAIGGGLVLCEIQQQSDITYRLYDYGRPRELHLERGLQVSQTSAHPGRRARVDLAVGAQLLAECEHFRTELHEFERGIDHQPLDDRDEILIFIAGNGTLRGQPYNMGDAWLLPGGIGATRIEPLAPTRFLRTWAP